MRLNVIFSFLKRIVKGRLKVAQDEGMTVEDNVTIMSGVDFGSEPYLITLKEGCRISNEVMFINHDGGTWAFRNTWDDYRDVTKFGEIVVGEYSFIGARSIILPGVHIGRNCVVGAGSVVTKDIPDESVVAGIPAKIVCSTKEYAERCKNKMPKDFDISRFQENKEKYLKEFYR